MKLLVHIGGEKTGTTSIQNWFATNRKKLLERGIFYSRALGARNHMRLYLACLAPGEMNRGFDLIGLTTQAEREALRGQVTEDLLAERQEAEQAGCHTFVISNEHLHSHLRDQSAVDRAAFLLQPIFGNIKILFGVRPQIDVAVSLCSTAARAGFQIDPTFFTQAEKKNRYYDYNDQFNRWAAVFGADRMVMIPFRRNPDMVAVFMQYLGLAHDDDYILPVRENEALDIRLIALNNRFRDRTPRPRILDRRQLNDLPCFVRIQPGIDVARRFQSCFEDRNAALIASGHGLTIGDLDPTWSRYEAASNLAILEYGDEQLLTCLADYVLDMKAELDGNGIS